jgi:hypothetical protein
MSDTDSTPPWAHAEKPTTPPTGVSALTAKQAVDQIEESGDVDQLKTWLAQEKAEKKRVTVVEALEERINDLGAPPEKVIAAPPAPAPPAPVQPKAPQGRKIGIKLYSGQREIAYTADSLSEASRICKQIHNQRRNPGRAPMVTLGPNRVAVLFTLDSVELDGVPAGWDPFGLANE